MPGVAADVRWRADLLPEKRAGMLFQQGVIYEWTSCSFFFLTGCVFTTVTCFLFSFSPAGVLIDTLNVEENLALSMQSAGRLCSTKDVLRLLELVGLRESDMHKMPNELSGGMLRRATLAQVCISFQTRRSRTTRHGSARPLLLYFVSVHPSTALGPGEASHCLGRALCWSGSRCRHQHCEAAEKHASADINSIHSHRSRRRICTAA